MSAIFPDTSPVLATERLTLRVPAATDLDDSAALWADPVVNRYILGGRPLSREETWHRLLRYAGLWAMLGYGYWTIRETQSGRFVGEIGLADFKREIAPSLDGEPEAGWVLATWAHGRGYAGEALAAVLAWVDGRPDMPRTACLIDPDNHASLRLARRFGYAEAARGSYKGTHPIIFHRVRAARQNGAGVETSSR